jgi:23S rRNA (guanosine2251-2'-O)-methyltransferase
MVAGRRPVAELLRAGKPADHILMARGVAPKATLEEILDLARAAGIPVRVTPRSELERVAGDANHQGVVALTPRFRYAPLESLLRSSSPSLLFLDGVMDPHNLGSLIRTSDCAGFDGVVLPTRRAAGVTSAVRRTSAGAAETVPVARVDNLARALDRARARGVWVLGLDGRAPSDIWTTKLAEPPVAIVCGAEDRGLSKSVRAVCDDLARIPLSGRIGSLNVAVAGAIAMFEVARRRALLDTL